MYVCMCACYVRMYVCMYVCVHVCMYACMHVCMSACLHVCMSACLHVCMSACLHVCMYVCMYVCVYLSIHVCMNVCIHACMCIYIWGQAQQQVVQHIDRRVKQWKKADCFPLLRRITRLKALNSEISSEDRNSYLERYSPKGSCHLDESSMSHTLAQNCHCEFCGGVHLTCKNTNNWMTSWIYIYRNIIDVSSQ